MYKKPNNHLTLGPCDMAIILREDGTLETSLPNVAAQDMPDNVATGAALVYALRNQDLCNSIYRNFAEGCSVLNYDDGLELKAV